MSETGIAMDAQIGYNRRMPKGGMTQREGEGER